MVRRMPCVQSSDSKVLPFSLQKAPRVKVRRVLIAEDSLLIALDLEKICQDFGCQSTVQTAFIAECLQIIRSYEIDFAFVDYRLADGTSEPVTDALKDRAIPFAFCTGQSKCDFAAVSQQAPVIWKPFLPEDVLRAFEQFNLTGEP